MIELNDVWWRYITCSEWALKGIHLKIADGEFVGIVGPNGAGKTSLAMCMNGLIPNNYQGILKGDTFVGSINTRERSVAEASKDVGFVFSDPESQFLSMTVEEEIVFGLENMGLPREEIRDRLNWVLTVSHLSEEYLEKPPYELSGGQKQKVAIAAVLAMKPSVIILDEPTSQLDPIGKSEVFDVLEELKRSYNATIIVIEHRMEKLATLASRMLLVHDGRIVKDAPPQKFFDDIDFILQHEIFPPEMMLVFSKLRKAGHYKKAIPLSIERGAQELKQLLPTRNGILTQIAREPVTGKYGSEIVKVENLEFAYPDGTLALKGVNLTIRQREFLAFIGQNGSGKTTLAKNIAGLLKPSSGRVLVEGQDTRQLPTTQLAIKIGYIFQNPDHQLFNDTVYKEIGYGPSNLQLSAEQIAARVAEAMKIVGLDSSYSDEHPFFLPKGLRQRVSIGSILALRPSVIIVDEPTTGQDFKQSREIMEFLKGLNALGHTIIIITHDMPIVARYAHRTICTMDGRILLDGPTRGVFREVEKLASTFVRPPETTMLAYKLKDLDVPADLLFPEEMFAWLDSALSGNQASIDQTITDRDRSAYTYTRSGL